MKVSFVLPMFSPVPIGGFRVVFEHANFLAAEGHQVCIVFPRRISAERRTPAQVVKDCVWWLRRLTMRPPLSWHSFPPGVRLRFVQNLQRLPNIVSDAVVATSWQTAAPVYRLNPSAGRKYYLVQHHETWIGDATAVNDSWRLPLRVIVIAKWLEDVGHELGVRDMARITNGLDFARFRLTVPIEDRPMRVVTMNHAETFKGVSDSLDALVKLHEVRPQVEVIMFGTMARGSDVPEWVKYFENPSQEVLVREVYNRSSVYVGASTVEGWGLPPAEAMACGCTFVGTDIGGFREFAVQGVNSMLSTPSDPDGLLQNLVRLTDDDDLRHRLQRRAFADIQRFTWKNAGSALLSHLERA